MVSHQISLMSNITNQARDTRLAAAEEPAMLERAFANAQETDGIEDWGRRFVRYEAARHANATPTIQEAAINDPWSSVRCAVLENRTVSPKILAIAIKDPEVSVRILAASHPNATPEILERALDDTDWGVRSAAAANKIAPREILVSALLDEDRMVAQDAAENWKARFTQEATLPPPATPPRTGGIRQ